MARHYGVASFASGHGMVVNSFTPDESIEQAEARDESGKVIDRWAYSKTRTVNVSGVYDDASNPPVAGETVTINGTTYLVETVSKPETNTGATELSFTATAKDSETIHPLSEMSSSSSSSN